MSSSENIELQVDLRFGELYRATLLMAIRGLRYLWIALVALVVLYAAGILYIWLVGPLNESVFGIEQWVATVLVGGVPTAILLTPIVIYIRARQFFRAEAGSLTRRYVFSSSGIDVQSPQVSAQVQWSAVREVRENRKFFFLYLLPTMANVLPKRCFASDATLNDFRTTIRANVKKTRLRA